MSWFEWLLLSLPLTLGVYTYAGYPLILLAWGTLRSRRNAPQPPSDWPSVTITLPAFNEEASLPTTLESLLQLDYPRDRVQILVISDASTDRTDEIAAGFSSRGVELLRMPRRSGKTDAENAALPHLRGEIIVNTDASIRIDPKGLKPLIAAFADPIVGVASGHDVSTRVSGESNIGESAYTRYEMWVRDMETRTGGIIGASGCLFAARAHLHQVDLPSHMFRDFAAPLIARERGLRSVTIPQAVCFVPRTPELRSEYRRKVRTITRGMNTLWCYRRLLNPLRYGTFAWKLFSHKVCRWVLPWSLLPALAVVLFASATQAWARWSLGSIAIAALTAVVGWSWPEEGTLPRLLAFPAAALSGNLAALHATLKMMAGDRSGTWDPTRRAPPSEGAGGDCGTYASSPR